jgi:SAM-dependent methyltransferase
VPDEVPNSPPLSPLVSLLRCLECGGPVEVTEIAPRPGYPELGPDGWLRCSECGERYPMIGGTPRMLGRVDRGRLADSYPLAGVVLDASRGAHPRRSTSIAERTDESFTYEWERFGALRPEWRKNFVDYMRPHGPEFFAGKLVLDVGAGSGRHSRQAAMLGAHVVAVDRGRSIDVARRNLPPEVLTVQADAQRLPFATRAFDFVMSIGVLHHLTDTRPALGKLVRHVATGGHLHVYLYWVPEVRWHREVLRLVSTVRRVTVRTPYRLLHALCYPLSAGLWLACVGPYRAMRARPRTARLATALPLKVYADYPFAVLVNDQFDRFSAPIEQRFTKAEVQAMFEAAGLEEVVVLPNHGWIGDGRAALEISTAPAIQPAALAAAPPRTASPPAAGR